jgi:hypothetical protein
MTKVVLLMGMSLDGFIAGVDDTVTEPAGRGGERLFAWFDDGPAARAVRGRVEARRQCELLRVSAQIDHRRTR